MLVIEQVPRRLGLTARSLSLVLACLVAACSDDGQERRRPLGETPSFADFMRVADTERGRRLFGRCAACHTVRMGAGDRNAPGLYDVMGKPVASNSRRFAYTWALRSWGGVWTPDRMDVWLAAPAKAAPGTSMNFGGVADPLDRADLIAFLQTQSVAGGSTAAPPP
ncbi:cytochrome C [Methylobacterium sp. Leaf123]|uniref:c-type cytochrome n=1 Tax=Methylobacterium sp. Leaf123 TaxID=1736264 RepID=UPI000701BEBF|nr:c-type cytochrome [Methylobacterium sp. Leaf123]KQQ25309.1 cytochrome C [Methylobacterium sp. Leaf123]